MADIANVQGDLCGISINGTEYLAAKIGITGLAGAPVWIKPTNIGQVIGALEGEFDIRVKATLYETKPSQVRSFLSFDGSGSDWNRKAGTLKPTHQVYVWDPADTDRLKMIKAPTAVLVACDFEHDGGDEPQQVDLEFRAVSNSAGEIMAIGPAPSPPPPP